MKWQKQPAYVVYLPWTQLFPSWGQHRFLCSARMWYCSQYIGGICMDRLGYMPAANLDIHSLMGLGMSSDWSSKAVF